MNHKNLKILLEHLYRTGVERGAYMPLLLWGEAGVGKSQAIKEAARSLFGIPEHDALRLNDRFRDVRVGQLDPVDLIGVPREREVMPCPWCGVSGPRFSDGEMVQHVRIRHPERVQGASNLKMLDQIKGMVHSTMPGAVELRMVFTTPTWFPQAEQRPGEKPGGFLFLDETNRGNKEVMQAIFQLLLDRKLHKSELPPGWIVVGAVNPSRSYASAQTKDEESTADYHGVQTDILTADKAMRSRFMHIALNPTVDDWLNYAANRGLSRLVRMAVANDPELLGRRVARIPAGIAPNPRTWVLYDRISRGLEGHEDVLIEVRRGMLGENASGELTRSVALPIKPLAMEEISTYISDHQVVTLANQRRAMQEKKAPAIEIDPVYALELSLSTPARKRLQEICRNSDDPYMKVALFFSMRNLMNWAERMSEEENWEAQVRVTMDVKDERHIVNSNSYKQISEIIWDLYIDGKQPDLLMTVIMGYLKRLPTLMSVFSRGPKLRPVFKKVMGESEGKDVHIFDKDSSDEEKRLAAMRSKLSQIRGMLKR
jgi:MoxR-like ATPase